MEATAEISIEELRYKGVYGFPSDRFVELNPRYIDPPLRLSQERRQRYDALFRQRKANLLQLLEEVGSIVNDSLVYDDENDYVQWVRKVSNYKPTENETDIGACVTAGNHIRKILESLGIERCKAYKAETDIVHAEEENGRVVSGNHDITIVYDPDSSPPHWVVLNSKSPLKPFNVVPKEKLFMLWSTYGVNKFMENLSSVQRYKETFRKEQESLGRRIDELLGIPD